MFLPFTNYLLRYYLVSHTNLDSRISKTVLEVFKLSNNPLNLLNFQSFFSCFPFFSHLTVATTVELASKVEEMTHKYDEMLQNDDEKLESMKK